MRARSSGPDGRGVTAPSPSFHALSDPSSSLEPSAAGAERRAVRRCVRAVQFGRSECGGCAGRLFLSSRASSVSSTQKVTHRKERSVHARRSFGTAALDHTSGWTQRCTPANVSLRAVLERDQVPTRGDRWSEMPCRLPSVAGIVTELAQRRGYWHTDLPTDRNGRGASQAAEHGSQDDGQRPRLRANAQVDARTTVDNEPKVCGSVTGSSRTSRSCETPRQHRLNRIRRRNDESDCASVHLYRVARRLSDGPLELALGA